MVIYSKYHHTFNAWICQTISSKIPAYPSNHSRIRSTCTCFTYIFLTSTICRTVIYIKCTATNRNKNVSILCIGNRQYNFSCIEQYLFRTFICNQKHSERSFKTIKLSEKCTNVSIHYHTSDMILYFYSDAYYWFIIKWRSCAGGVHLLSHSKP